MGVVREIMTWFGSKVDRTGVQKLDEYEYEVIDKLIKVGCVDPHELADLLGISLSRAQYEIKQSKDRQNARSTTKGK